MRTPSLTHARQARVKNRRFEIWGELPLFDMRKQNKSTLDKKKNMPNLMLRGARFFAGGRLRNDAGARCFVAQSPLVPLQRRAVHPRLIRVMSRAESVENGAGAEELQATVDLQLALQARALIRCCSLDADSTATALRLGLSHNVFLTNSPACQHTLPIVRRAFENKQALTLIGTNVYALQERLTAAEVALLRATMEAETKTTMHKETQARLLDEIERLQAETSKFKKVAEQAVLEASKRAEAALLKQIKKLEDDRKDSGKKELQQAKARVKELEEQLSKAQLASQKETVAAIKAAEADASSASGAELDVAKRTAKAAESRAAAAESQLRSQEALFEQLSSLLKDKQAAEATVGMLEQERRALQEEAAVLRAGAAAASEKATESLAKARAADSSLAERVRATLAAAEACVGTADTVKQETDRAAASSAEVAAAVVAAAEKRAVAAEAALMRQQELLDMVAEGSARTQAAEVALVESAQRISALQGEVQALREQQKASDALAATAAGRAQAAEASISQKVASSQAAAAERVQMAEAQLAAASEALALQQAASSAEIAALTASAKASTLQAAVRLRATDRLQRGMQEALETSERSAAAWRRRADGAAQALAWLQAEVEAGGGSSALAAPSSFPADGGSDGSSLVPAPFRGRLRAALGGAELRRVLAKGPRVPKEAEERLLDYQLEPAPEPDATGYERVAVGSEKAKHRE